VARPVNPPGATDLPVRIQLTVLEAEGRIARGEYPQAVELLEQAIRNAPDNPRVRKSLGMAYLARGERAKALGELLQAANGAPDDLMLQVLIGHLQASANQPEAAIVALRTALACTSARPEEPLTAEAMLSLGELLSQQGYLSAALECYAKLYDWIDRHGREYSTRPRLGAVVLRPEVLLARRGDLLMQLARHAEAASLLRQALSRDRTKTRTAELLMRNYIAMGDYSRGEKLLVDLSAEPSQRGQLAGLAEALCRSSGQQAMPGRIWRACQRAGWAGGELAVALAAAARQLGAPREGAAIVDSALRRNPGDIEVVRYVAEGRVHEGKVDAALEQLARLLDANPEAGPAVTEVVAEIAASGLSDDFEQRFAERLPRESTPVKHALYCVLGELAAKRSKDSLAEELFAQAIGANERFGPAYEALAELYLAGRRLDDLEGLQKRIDRLAAKAPEVRFLAHYLAGKVQLACGHARAGVEALERAADLNKRHLPALLLLGEAYACLGQDSKAAETFLEASRLSPEDAGIYRQAFDRYAAVGQWEPAREIVARLLESQPDSVPGRCMMVELLAMTRQREEAWKLLRDLRQQAGDDDQVQLLSLRAEMDSVGGLLSRRQFERLAQRLGEIVAKAPGNTKARLALSELLARVGMDVQAAEQLQSLHRQQPAHCPIARTYAAALLRADRSEQAAEVLQTVLAENADDLPSRQLLLEALEKLKRFDRAAALGQQWLSETRDVNARNWYRMRLLAFFEQSQDYPQAQKLLDEWIAEDIDPTLKANLRANKVRLFGLAGQRGEAVEYCRRWIAQFPADDPRPKYRLIAALSEGKLYDQAQECLAQWAEVDVENAQAFREARIELYGQSGRIDQAETLAYAWLDEAPWSLRPRRALIGVLVRAEQYDKAQELMDRWLAQLAPLASAASQSAPASRAASRPATAHATRPAIPSQAEQAATQTSQTSPATASAPVKPAIATTRAATTRAARTTTASRPTEAMRRMEAQVAVAWCREAALGLLVTRCQYEQAIERARRYASVEPNEPEYLNIQSTCLMELGRASESIATLEAALAANPQEGGLKNNLGYNYAEQGVNLAKAEQLIRDALSTRGDEPAYLDSLGWVMYKQGRLSEAAAVFDRMLQSGRRDGAGYALMYDHAGDVLYRLGWTEKAIQRWTKALDLAKAEKLPKLETRQILRVTPVKIEAANSGAAPPIAPLGQGIQPPGE